MTPAHDPSSGLAVGVGLRPGTFTTDILAAVAEVSRGATIRCLATVDRRANDPGLVAAARRLGVPLRTYSATELDAVPVPNPDSRTKVATGTASVAEAAALLASGARELLCAKRIVNGVTVASATVRPSASHRARPTRPPPTLRQPARPVPPG